MNLLVVDLGNSRCKFCHGPLDQDFPASTFQAIPGSAMEVHLSGLPPVDACVACSVDTELTPRLVEILSGQLSADRIRFLTASNAPLKLLVDHPQTLGTDRMAAALGAFQLTTAPTIIIDSGTATTVDWVDDQGSFRGGAIFPGIQLCLQALAQHADQLPKVEFDQLVVPQTLGRNTRDAIRSGVFWSHVGGVERIIRNLRSEFGPSELLATGGWGKWILDSLEVPGTYRQSLVLEGLWRCGYEWFS